MKFAIIIGAQKSGTTSLFQYLGQHSEIAPCSERKQVAYFTKHWERSEEWYRSLWDWDAEQHTWALEASPSYTMYPHYPNAASRIDKMDTDFRFIYLLRHPVDRIRSHYHHGMYVGEVDKGLGFEEALNRHPELLDFTRYATQLRQYDNHFPKEQIFVLTLERLSSQPEQILQKICYFLEVDPDFEFSGLRSRYNTKASQGQVPSFYRLMRSIKPLRATVRRWIPMKWRDHFRSLVFEQSNEVDYPDPTPSQRRYILEELEEELIALGRDERVDISHWNIDPLRARNIT